MEIIRRLEGRSRWHGEQPEGFVAGMISRPTGLRLGGGSAFVGLRLWPWTWRALSGRSPAELMDRWAGLDEQAPAVRAPATPEAALSMIRPTLLDPLSERIARATLEAHGCSDLAARTGLSPRTLQRWFARHVGSAPRTYLRLLRFSDAFAELPGTGSTLAAHAADHGFADQSHMAREFRSLAGTPAEQARTRASGPFLSGG